MKLRAGLTTALTVLLALGACTSLPRGAALRSEIVGRAQAANPAEAGFAFYPVNRQMLARVQAWPAVNPRLGSGWPAASRGETGLIIAPGDMVNIRVWDSEQNSLLTGPEQRTAELGDMRVSPSGRVFVPYVGEVRIAGMSPERAREAIQAQLVSSTPSAQVQLSLASGRANTVDLVSGVERPGSYPLPDRNYSVLGLLSQGGGIPASMRNPRIKLHRGSKLYAISARTLYDHPGADSVLLGGDKLIVEPDDRFFLSLGAAGKEDLFYFDQDKLTALEALARIGGLSDSRADPSGILVLREYPRTAMLSGGPSQERVVFAIDLTTADGLFSAKNFQIFPGDVVLATESPVTSLRTAFALVGTAFGLANRVDNLTN